MTSSPFQFEQPVRSVAIIGAGPSGLAVAHALLKEPAPSASNLSAGLDQQEPYFRVTLFDRQATIGGVWNYTPETKPATDNYPAARVPATNPLLYNNNNDNDHDGWYNAMYRDLETNIPTEVMQFANTPFPPGTDVFPSAREVRDYVRAYGRDLEPLVRLRTQVIDAHKEGSSWVVTSRHLDEPQGNSSSSAGTTQVERFDALVLATGHYDTPYIPEVPGLHAFAATHPGVVAHAKAFSVPEAYKDKRVLIVGNSASGFDIASEVAGGGASRVYRSSRGSVASSSPADETVQDPRVEDRPLISEYRASPGEVIFTDGTSLILGRDFDHVLYCTGYLYAFPFLKTYIEPAAVGDDSSSNDENNDNMVQYHPKAKTSNRLYRLYRQLIYYPDPTLAVMVMTKQTVPFPLAESQGAVLARVYSGRLQLPAAAAMRAAEREREREIASAAAVAEDDAGVHGQAFHSFKFPRDVEYYRLLQTWLDEVVDRPDQGFHPLVWDDVKYQQRQRASQLKLDRIRKRLDKVREDLEKDKN
ncbi:hypothetical protein D0Z00_001040 [Geotrichum galactomycetum]|uniref:Uncharacterized protein n=1 Tax=Geotrichum galactomycetum TaxID=27317 RepID=A0ACB6V864_9ASCO|nr:hypothetical protein D0Z00_001040 [Geotrichum candidum]